jgi:uncharacterized damage-inducible protein DinB
MKERVQALAAEFERANDELIAAVEGLSDGQWRTLCEGEGWSVAVTAHHVAVGHAAVAEMLRMAARGEARRPSFEQLHERNARHAEEYAEVGQAETIDLLRRNGAEAVAVVRGFDDADLEIVPGGDGRSPAVLIERVLIGHVRGHLASIQTAVG